MLRHYQIQTSDGVVSLPSVTTILDATMPLERRSQLEQAKAKNPQKSHQVMDAGRRRGDYIHRYVAARMRGDRMGHGEHGRWLRQLDPLLAQLLQHRSEGAMFWIEQQCHSLRHRYAGTFDLLCEWPDYGWVLSDFKSAGYRLYPDALHSGLLQAAAYRLAWGEQHPPWLSDEIAVVYCLPSGLHTTVVDGRKLDDLTAEWLRRRANFGARLGAVDG